MPNTASSKKRLRQNVVRRTRNRATKSVLRGLIRKVLESIEAGEVDASEEQFRLTAKRLDKAAANNVIHRNRAARVKSRLSAKIKALKTA
jgi:small subunit ribosomal protein S20